MMDQLDKRIEEAKREGCFSSQINERFWAAYPANDKVVAVGVGHTEKDAWKDLFCDLDNGMAYIAAIESIQQIDAP